MSNNNFLELYNKFTLLDNNTQIMYIILFVTVLFIIFNFIPVTTKLINSLLLTSVIFIMIIYKRYSSIDNDLKKIDKINTSLDLINFKNVSSDLDICSIYLDIIEFRNIDKYSFANSLKDTDKYIEIYNDIKKGNNEYAQLLDVASDKKDSALNHLLSISNSITPNIGITNLTNNIIQNPLENKLNDKIHKLRIILDKYWFEMADMARTIYETQPINIMSRPIVFDTNAPKPKIQYDGFDIFYGNIDP